jgi:hypothetical protein
MPQPHTLDGSTIPTALVKLGKHTDGGDQSSFSDASTYNQLVATWRGDQTVPTEQELQDALDALETDNDGNYADGMRAERNRLIDECNGFHFRHLRQRDEQGRSNADRSAAADALSDTDFTTLMEYVKDLADLPANIASGSDPATYGTFMNPIWPTKPAFLP